MTDVTYETERRLRIIDSIKNDISPVVRAICVGGSMGFSQYHSVRESSDIDMMVIVDQDRLDDLIALPYFQGEIPSNVVDLLKSGKINLSWVVKEIEGVEVNTFVYETSDFARFCALSGELVGYIQEKPEDTQRVHGFGGEVIEFDREVTPCGEGYLYSKPSLVDGRFWGGVPRADFIYPGYYVYEQGPFLTNLEKVVWETMIRQLIKEHGPEVDLSKHNILNSLHTFHAHPERIPHETITRIQERTRRELERANQ